MAAKLIGAGLATIALAGAAIGGFATYILSSPININVQFVPTWDQVKNDAVSHGVPLIKSAYFGGKMRSILNEVFSLGKIVTITGDSFVSGQTYNDSNGDTRTTTGTLTSNLIKYFKNHKLAKNIANALTEFHSRNMGYGYNEAPSQFSGICDYFNSQSTFLYGNCFQASVADQTSTFLNGATVIGSYTQMLDAPFAFRGTFTGNPLFAPEQADLLVSKSTSDLASNFLRHRVSSNGKMVYDGRARTKVNFSGKISYNKINESLARRMNNVYFKLGYNPLKNLISLMLRGF